MSPWPLSQFSPGFTLESGQSGFPEAARPRPHQCPTAWIQPPWIMAPRCDGSLDSGPRCDGVPGYWGPGLRVHWPRLTTLPTSRIGGTMIQDHRITALHGTDKNQGRPPMTERPEWTHVSVWTLPPLLIYRFNCHYCAPTLTVTTLTRVSTPQTLPMVCRKGSTCVCQSQSAPPARR
jgi:hypothetical protein